MCQQLIVGESPWCDGDIGFEAGCAGIDRTSTELASIAGHINLIKGNRRPHQPETGGRGWAV